MDVLDELLEIERALAAGDGDTYRAHLADEALVIVPGMALDRDACAAAMDASPGWDETRLEDARLLRLADGAAAIAYRFEGARGDTRYAALMASTYVRRDGAWRLALHQQTPLEG